MKKQWCIPLLFLGVLCSAFPLEFRLDGGASRWGFSARGNGISQPWNGGAPVSVTMTCELFNAPGVDRPVMPWQSWTGILMEDGENRYIGGLLCPGNRTPEVDYGAVVYEKRGNFSWKNSGRKFRLAAGPLVLRFSFDGKELVLEAGKSVNHLEVVWKKTPSHGFLPKRIGFVLDTAQAGSVMDRFAVHSFTVRGKGAAAEWNLSDQKSWRRDFLTLKPLGEKREVPCTDLTDRLNRELARKSVRIGRGCYTFGSVRMPEGASLIFEDGAELRIGDRSEIRILGDRCRIEGGLWNLECFSRKAPLLVGKKVSGVTIRGITVSGFGKQNLPRLGFDFAYFDSCADLTVEGNRIAGLLAETEIPGADSGSATHKTGKGLGIAESALHGDFRNGLVAPGEKSHPKPETAVKDQTARRTLQLILEYPVQSRRRDLQSFAEEIDAQFRIGKILADQRQRIVDDPQILVDAGIVAGRIREDLQRDRRLDPRRKRRIIVHQRIQTPEQGLRVGMTRNLMTGIAV